MTTRFSMRGRAWVGAACALVALTAIGIRPARAQQGEAGRVSLEVRGEWAGTDDAARGRAVDQAFATAVQRALASLVSDKDREAHRDELDKGVVRRARLFVASYRVTSEKADGGRTQVAVSATLDLDKLRAALAELKVPVAAGATGQLGASFSPSGGGGGPSAVLLIVVSTPDGTVANFGRGGGDGGAAGDALGRELQSLGLTVRSPRGQQVAVTTGEGAGGSLLPVGDEAAVDLARRVGAGSAWVVGMDVRADGVIRSTRLQGAAGRGKLRVIDVERGEVIAEAEADAAGFDRAVDQAAAVAARELAQRLTRAVSSKVSERWSAPASTGGPQVVVRVRGAHSWASIGALIHKLGSTSGVDAVHAREVVRGRVALGVETRLAPARVAAALLQARLPAGTIAAQARGERQVDVEIRGDTTTPVTGAQDSGDAGPE